MPPETIEILEIPATPFPMWIAILLLLLNLFREPISILISKTFPTLADKHFSYKAKQTEEDSEYRKTRETKILTSELETAKMERQKSEMMYQQLVDREKNSMDIINEQFKFMQKLIDTSLLQMEATVIEEIMSLKMSFEKLERTLRGGYSTQDALLDRIMDEPANPRRDRRR